MLYATGMFVPDPFIFLRARGRDYVVMSDLEIDRARKQAPHCRVLSLSRYQQKLRDEGIKQPGFADVVPAVAARAGHPARGCAEGFLLWPGDRSATAPHPDSAAARRASSRSASTSPPPR